MLNFINRVFVRLSKDYITLISLAFVMIGTFILKQYNIFGILLVLLGGIMMIKKALAD